MSCVEYYCFKCSNIWNDYRKKCCPYCGSTDFDPFYDEEPFDLEDLGDIGDRDAYYGGEDD